MMYPVVNERMIDTARMNKRQGDNNDTKGQTPSSSEIRI